MASHTEFIAILSSGISFRKILIPYMMAACMLAALSFYLDNFLIPYANVKRIAFENRYLKEPTHLRVRDIHLQIKPEGTFIYVQTYIDASRSGYKFSLEKINAKGLHFKLTSDYVQWDSLRHSWKLINYYKRTVKGFKESISFGKQLDTVLNLKPSDLSQKVVNVEVMNFAQLRKFIADQKMKGSDNILLYEVQKYKRIASPFATIVLTLIGFALASRKIRGGIGMHLGAGIAISFAYILFMQVSDTFGNVGSLPPVIAVWLPNVIFFFIGLYLLKTAPK